MIRTGQSLLANCLSILELGRDWRRASDSSEDEKEAKIIFLFIDSPLAPFSIHNFVWHGEAACGKMPGEWFGPSAAASSIKALQNSYSQDMQVYISSGSDVYENHFMKTAISPDGQFRPTLILLGLRLGIDTVNKVYWESLKFFLSCSQAVGIAGGRPSSSHYFMGYQGDYLFYLDPHFPRPSLNATTVGDLKPEAFQSVHTNRIRRLHLQDMDPSMLVGILIRDQNDWDAWKAQVLDPKTQKIVHISPAPAIIRRSSIMSGSDDDEGFVDVSLEPCEDSDAVIVESIPEEYDKCQDYEDTIERVHSQPSRNNSRDIKFDTSDSCVFPESGKLDMVESPKDDEYNLAGQSIFLMDNIVESSATREDTPEINKGVVLVEKVDNFIHNSQVGSVACEDSESYNHLSGSPVAVSLPKHNNIPIPGKHNLQSSSASISSSPIKISKSYMTDKSSESEDWEYMAKSDATIQKSSA